jgi:hypothetical protein
MATPEEIRLQKELNDLQQENVRLKRVDVDLSFSLLENLKETLGIQSRNTEYEKTLLKTNKDINRALVNRLSGYNTSKSITSEIAKNEDLVSRSQILQKGLQDSINASRKNGADATIRSFQAQQSKQAEIEKELQSLEEGKSIDAERLTNLKNAQASIDANTDALFKNLNVLEKEYVLTQLQTDEIEKQNNLYKEDLSRRGAGEQVLEVLNAIPGLSYIARKAQSALNEEQQKGNKNISYFKLIAKEAFSPFNLAIAALGLISKSILDINRQQVEFGREVGNTLPPLEAISNNLVSVAENIATISALTQQFGFNAAFAFDQINLQSAAELVKLTGLSAEEAGNLALFSQTTGTSLEDNLDTLITQTGQINIANKSSVTQRQIFRDIGNVSKAIALTFQGNVSALGKAAQQARILGVNLSQVDKIAGGLLDIESSIAAEFEAEVISGKQLNLERARFFALTNDLEGVTRELANNQEALNSFTTGTRLEQEAIAQALGMSREEMAEMIFQQRIQLGITDEQAAKTAGLTQADFERLTIQESIAASITKIGDVLGSVIEPVLRVVSDYFGAIVAAVTTFAGISLYSTIAGLAKAAIAAGSIGAALNPLSIAAAVGGVIAIGIAMNKAFGSVQNVGDAIIPSSGGPIISTREGGLIQGTRNDDVIMAPNIANRNDRNRGLTSSDIQAIASAVKEGASAANINLDGGRVSSRLQVPSVINQRQYSY